MNGLFESLTLYGYWRSSCTWRVRIALAHKGLAYDYVPVNIAPTAREQFSPGYTEKNAMQQVPLLELKGGARSGQRLAQSVAICELLEELKPSPSLLPAEPWARAQVRQLVEIVNSGTQPLQNPLVTSRIKSVGGDGEAWAREVIAKGLGALERTAKGSAGRFLVGDAVTLADVFLVPQLYNARRFDVPLDAFPTLTRVDAVLGTLPAFIESHPDRMPDAPKKN
ncbi:MAG: maleylacetoacetate isomerase [Archangiaceae bacterium]|nr:maleylacetoacetate isomerase [Archangiaceae bacterium]